MDILSHFLTGVAIGAAVASEPKQLIATGVAATLPDLINGLPSQTFLLWKKRREIVKEGLFKALKIGTVARWREVPKSLNYIYQSFHSAWLTLIISTLLWFFVEPIYSLAYASHLLIDVFTHQAVAGVEAVTAVRPFWPFSNWQWPWSIAWWQYLKWLWLFYLVIILVIIGFLAG